MSKKKITIKSAAHLRGIENALDAWVNNNTNSPETKTASTKSQVSVEEETRFTIVIPTYLHRRIKKKCAVEGLSMKNLLKEILLDAFPES